MKRNPFVFSILLLFVILPVQAQLNGEFTDRRDGHVYRWIEIGDQVWMAENLAYLPEVNRVADALFDGECFYVYQYDGIDPQRAKSSVYYQKYGVLYNWTAATSACPDGWHLPEDTEWQTLEKHLGMMNNELKTRGWRISGETGTKLKSEIGWYVDTGRNEVGFHALPGGCRGYGGFESEGYCAYFWTASPAGGDNGWRRGFCCDDDGSCREEDRRYFGCSVRCIKDYIINKLQK